MLFTRKPLSSCLKSLKITIFLGKKDFNKSSLTHWKLWLYARELGSLTQAIFNSSAARTMNSHSNQYLPRGWKTLEYGSFAIGIHKTAVYQLFWGVQVFSFLSNAAINITAVGSTTKQSRLWKQDFRVICHVQATVKKDNIKSWSCTTPAANISVLHMHILSTRKCIQIHRETNGFANVMHSSAKQV